MRLRPSFPCRKNCFGLGLDLTIVYIAHADEVYMELKGRAKDAILSAIEKERDGEQIDRVLLKNVLSIFIEVGMGGNECYENDFECEMLTASGEHYNRKAASWVESDSCPEYMLKAEECLKQVHLCSVWCSETCSITVQE